MSSKSDVPGAERVDVSPVAEKLRDLAPTNQSKDSALARAAQQARVRGEFVVEHAEVDHIQPPPPTPAHARAGIASER